MTKVRSVVVTTLVLGTKRARRETADRPTDGGVHAGSERAVAVEHVELDRHGARLASSTWAMRATVPEYFRSGLTRGAERHTGAPARPTPPTSSSGPEPPSADALPGG